MTYIENIFICMLAPMLIAMLCVEKNRRCIFVQVIVGMGMCLISAYINTFIAGFHNADIQTATLELTPVIEEIMKLLPSLFYIVVFEPTSAEAKNAIIVIAISFATFENICYLTANGADKLFFLMVRGFGTGAMHIVCGAMVGCGLVYIWEHPWLKPAGTFALLCSAITYHALYNLLISAGGAWQTIAYVFPVVTLLISVIIKKSVKFNRKHY